MKPTDANLPPELAKAFEVKELAPVADQIKLREAAQDAVPQVEKRSRKKGRKSAKTNGAVQDSQNAAPSASSEAKTAQQAIAGPGSATFAIPNRRPEVDPIWVGEKIWMDVTWLNTKAGEFELEVLPFKVMNGRKVYDFKGMARTSELFSLVYRAEDWVESFVDYEGWFPYKFELHGDETKHIRNNYELYDHGAKRQFVAMYDNRIQKNEIVQDKGYKDLTPFSQDSLSAIYYARTLKFEDGKKLHFPMTTNGSQWETEVTIMGREEVQTKMGYMKAIKCKVETRFNGVLQQQGDAFMWFSDDEKKYLLRFEAKVRIGWVAGVTKKIEAGAPEQPGVAAPPTDIKKAPDTTLMNHPKGAKKRIWFHNLIESLSGTKK